MQTKKLLLLMFFFCLGFSSMAQVEIGFQVSPGVSGNRFIADDKYNFTNSNNLRLGVGLIADYFFSQNYAFSTGLLYRSKGGEITYNYSRQVDGSTVTMSGQDNISVQYVEVPLTIKLFTNELAPGTVAYFQAGGSLNTKVGAKVNDKRIIANEKVSKRFNLFEADVVLGGGVEYVLGQSTKVFGGVSYHRGLTNIDNYYKKEEQLNDSNLSIRNSGFSLDVGIKF
ncbi:porin family protein [Botryobacter ruber]|uniref:porin family protein n=1 Tax=Botryobacter ruber TaxID=2171629 RepID=UPI000E0BB851|nr:porin family protein [Botryobacter ruber]